MSLWNMKTNNSYPEYINIKNTYNKINNPINKNGQNI